MTRLQAASARVRRSPVTGSGLLVCAPLRLEARAVRRGLRSQPASQRPVQVVVTGYGPRRSGAA